MSSRILLWGDSLVEGKPGVAFASILMRRFPDFIWVNLGKGGDTLRSLEERLESRETPARKDRAALALLWVGVNDVLADIVPGLGIWKTAMRQPPVRNDGEIADIYRRILERLAEHAVSILAIPPLFVGEDPDTTLNARVRDVGDRLKDVVLEFSACRFVDMRSHMPLAPGGSSYFPVNPWSKILKIFGGVGPDDFDLATKRRGLKWTYDGIHLNSRGAEMAAQILAEEISRKLLM